MRTSEGGSVVSDGYWSDGTSVYYIEGGGLIQSVNACSATPPPPPLPPPPPSETWTGVILAFGTGGGGGTACSNANNGAGTQYYMDGATFGTSTRIRTNSDGTGIPRNTNYSDGNTVRFSTSGALGGGTACDTV